MYVKQQFSFVVIVVFLLLILNSLFSFQLRSEHRIYTFLQLIIGDANDVTNDPTRSVPSVDLCIANFLKVEKRKIKCDSKTPCNGIIATLTNKIVTKPRIMLIHLGRFNPDKSSEPVITKKNTNPLELTARLSFDMPVSTSLPTEQCDIRSIIHHIGSTVHGGHYTTSALRNNQWVTYDDETTVEKNFLDIIRCNQNQKTAYIMMYKESDSDSHVVSTTNNQGENGVTNKTINAPTSGICKTQDDIQNRLEASRIC